MCHGMEWCSSVGGLVLKCRRSVEALVDMFRGLEDVLKKGLVEYYWTCFSIEDVLEDCYRSDEMFGEGWSIVGDQVVLKIR